MRSAEAAHSNQVSGAPHVVLSAATVAAQVHCDSNTDPACKSTQHTGMLTGYIQSMGYQFLVKPHAWATFIADRHSRNVAHPNRQRYAGNRQPVLSP